MENNNYEYPRPESRSIDIRKQGVSGKTADQVNTTPAAPQDHIQITPKL